MQVTRINGVITKEKKCLHVRHTCLRIEFSQLDREQRYGKRQGEYMHVDIEAEG